MHTAQSAQLNTPIMRERIASLPMHGLVDSYELWHVQLLLRCKHHVLQIFAVQFQYRTPTNQQPQEHSVELAVFFCTYNHGVRPLPRCKSALAANRNMTRKILDTKSVTCVSSHYFVVTREKKISSVRSISHLFKWVHAPRIPASMPYICSCLRFHFR